MTCKCGTREQTTKHTNKLLFDHQGWITQVIPTFKEFCQNKFMFILLFWLPGIFDKFILFSSSGNVTFI